ncbi:MAG: EamA family transporter [Anaerolineae bacterium]|nr:EamA family transporter [Anaerolineae bacterium]
MWSSLSPRARAVAEAVLVTFLWSSSFVLIKIGLRDTLPPLSFAALRYGLAFVCLLVIFLARGERHNVRGITRMDAGRLVALGLLYYGVTMATQFIGLSLLPAISVNLLLSFSTIVVIGLGMLFLSERPTGLQWVGVAIYLGGVGIYYYPFSLPAAEQLGIVVVLIGMLSNAASSVFGRALNRAGRLSPLAITTISMGIGAAVLLAVSLVVDGVPHLQPLTWALIAWMAVVNTAFAFVLWNRSLRVLTAMESSLINNLMLAQIPLLAWLFLGESFSTQAGIGFTIAALGVLAVQLRRLPGRRRDVQGVEI